MENCLKQKLKNVVNNDSLNKIGHFFINVTQKRSPSQADSRLILRNKNNTAITITPLDGGYFANSFADLSDPSKRIYDPITVSNQLSVYLPNMNFRIDVDSKYEIEKIGYDGSNTIYGVNLADLKYSPMNHIQLNGSQTYGNVNDCLGDKNISRIDLANTNIECDISTLNWSTLTKISMYGLNEKCTGNISSLKSNTNLTSIIFTDTTVSGTITELATCTKLGELRVNHTNVSGEINELATGMAARRNNGDTLLIYCNGIITLDGEEVSAGTIKTITFDGQGDYTVS